MARKRITTNDPILSGGGSAAQSRRNPAGTIRPKHSTVPSETFSPSEFQQPQAVKASEPAEPRQPHAVKASEPSREAIARLAFSYWEARGCQGGSAQEDWLRAEQELRRAEVAVA